MIKQFGRKITGINIEIIFGKKVSMIFFTLWQCQLLLETRVCLTVASSDRSLSENILGFYT
jgi:hypothetical protein